MERQRKDGLADKGRGLRVERELIEAFGWYPSSPEQNIFDDIDAFTEKDTALSIKSISAKTFQSGNLAFELEVEWVGRGWVESWFLTGKATKYIFSIEGKGLYVVDKAQLVRYIEKEGWPVVKRHRAATRAKQIEIGHGHIDAKVGLIPLATLTRLGIAKRLVYPQVQNHD